MGNALQGGHVFQIIQLLRRDFALDHIKIQADEAAGVLHGAALDQVDHQGSRGLGDGASCADESGILDLSVHDPELQGDVIAAAGVDALQAVGGTLHRVAVLFAAAVLGNDLCIELVQVHKPITFRTFSRLFSRASTSSSVL